MTAFQSFFAEHEDPDVPVPAKARLDGALTVRYATRAAEERQAAGKDTGTIRFEILRLGVLYHLENAGLMQDGTPLFAVFMCDPVTSEHTTGGHALASLRRAPTVHAW
jgi:hypothetical protein